MGILDYFFASDIRRDLKHSERIYKKMFGDTEKLSLADRAILRLSIEGASTLPNIANIGLTTAGIYYSSPSILIFMAGIEAGRNLFRYFNKDISNGISEGMREDLECLADGQRRSLGKNGKH